MKTLGDGALLTVPSEGHQILPMGVRLGMLLIKEQCLDNQWETIDRKTIKLILKLRAKIPNFKASAKILKQFDHLWIQLLLVKKRQTKKIPATDYSEHKEKSTKRVRTRGSQFIPKFFKPIFDQL